ncbi:Dabb family protein [Aquipseudomonas campi]
MPLVKHIVMWNLKGDTEQEKHDTADLLKRAFEGLNGLIPGMLSLEIGIDFSRIEYACDVVLYSEFESTEALQGYATHPEHARVRAELDGLRITRHQVDYLA